MTIEEMLQKAHVFITDENDLKSSEAERVSFMQRFPKESLKEMTVEQYADTKTKDCFIYWLEQKNMFGGIGGGNASKFGIFRSANGDYSRGFGKNRVKLFDEALQEEFQKLKEGYLKALHLADEDRYDEIQQLKLPIFNTVLLKVLHIYNPEKFLNVFSAPILKKLGESLKVDPILFELNRLVELNHEVLKALKNQEGLSDWSTSKLGRFVWDTYSSTDSTDKLDVGCNYWLIGHTYETIGSQKDYFIQNKCVGTNFLSEEDLSAFLWDDNLMDIIEAKEPEQKGRQALKGFFQIKTGDYIALKSTFTRKDGGVTKSVLKISAIGRATADAVDGYKFDSQRGHLLPVEWIDLKEKEFIGYGGYRKTIAKTDNRKTINYVFLGKPFPLQELRPLLQIEVKTTRNLILYGPPGTGKTYEVSRKALELTTNTQIYEEICNQGREAIQNEYTRLVRTGNVRFVTFHQSYSYEDFIEGLRSDGKGNFVPEDGLFKRAAMEALYAGLNNNVRELSDEVHFERTYDYLVGRGKELQIQFTSKTGATSYISNVSPVGNLIVMNEGAQTESTISKDRLLRIFRYVNEHQVQWQDDVHFINKAIGGSNETRYWSVFKWIMDNLNEERDPIVSDDPAMKQSYQEKKDIVLKALEQGESFDFSNADSYVLIVDEINRGNISKIFGEMLTLIEEDKRLTKRNQLIVELPYTKERFTLPPNLHLIGTMNTADRSIALMDTALRRRFLFEEIMPNPELLDTVGSLDLEELLTVINKRIEVLYDRNHTIGHAYLMNANTEESVIEVVQHKIIPLLQEYFYDDWEKIGMILGGIGKSKDDPFIIYEEHFDYSQLFKHNASYPTRKQYRVKSKITSQEIAAIYEI
ncbi:McrB family protein [Paenibacillus solisilvae]|uniref:McrB family protein n=1 Tax=Paenibacillus solisilvae TaxID=2486751 RepID=A0ABW0VV08_9BACL